ncbi:MAG: choice-of-anchor J domain-containing protein, partial [Muribaculaceae bacterium]|nr:choice-of-anchor J domain-containing protein [Muribaculaceae bacterium]
MKKFLLTFAIGAFAFGSFGSAEAATIYCTQIGGYTPGVNTFPSEGGSLEMVYSTSAMADGLGAAFTSDAVYMAFSPSSYSRYCTKFTFDSNFENWSSSRIIDNLKMSVPSALGWNSITGAIYGCFKNSDNTTYSWGTLNTSDGMATIIAPLDKQLVSIVASPSGSLYAIDIDGTFYSATTEGELTEIGATGVTPSSKYCAGIAFDPDTEILYWTPINKSMDTSLYTIDITTGVATKVADLADGTKINSLYIPEGPAPEGAPADVEDFLALPDGFQNKLDITFTLPTKTQGGEDMLGAVKYKVMVDQTVLADTQGGPGQAISLSCEPGIGEHTVTLFLSNNAGKGNRAVAKIYVGQDTPGAVTGLKISADGKTITLNWEAPEVGMNGGNFDTSALRYEVVRVNDNEIVASDLEETTFTETVNPESLENFSYTVTPKCGDLTGPATTTPSVLIGDGMKPPYEQKFDDPDSFDEIYFSTYDANNDGSGWTLYKNYYGTAGNARYNYSTANDADDWLFTCPLSLESGYKYAVSFNLTCGSSMMTNGERMGVSYGKLPEVSSMTETLIPDTDYPAGFNQLVEAYLQPETSGTYYLGFHAVSPKDNYTINLDNLKIEAGISIPTGVNNVLNSLTGVRAGNGAIEVVCENQALVMVYGVNGNLVAESESVNGS